MFLVKKELQILKKSTELGPHVPCPRVPEGWGAEGRRPELGRGSGALADHQDPRPGWHGAAAVGGNSSPHSPFPPGFQPVWLQFSFSNISQLSAGKWGDLVCFITEHLPGVPQEYVQGYMGPCGDPAEGRQALTWGLSPPPLWPCPPPSQMGKDWTSLLPGAQQCVCVWGGWAPPLAIAVHSPRLSAS